MGVTLYRSTDASAPSLNGNSGSLISVLDACLVNGYGSQPAAGWTKAYSGTNQADYKQGTGSNGYYLDVNDNAPTTSQEARMRGYEVMTALGTGTNAFPTASQSTFGVICRKSTATGTTARTWYLIADATCFYLFVETGDNTSPIAPMCFAFGDFFSLKASDTYGTMIIGRNVENANYVWQETFGALMFSQGIMGTNTTPAHYIDRHWTGVGGAIGFNKCSSYFAHGSQNNNPVVMGSQYSLLPYPNGPDGGLELAPVYIVHGGFLRGYLKGIWCPCHNQPLSEGDTVTGTGNMSGKTFLALNHYSTVTIAGNSMAGTGQGQVLIETSNTWS
ncbi:hypothetical protein NLI96_g13288 [Meripilus lineatus]|uniref:Uncharacterized protein n=1 Tax=Meripilus lineatus TaxID=2056292 RepID=A0AAD5YBM4_9APHY|nr:hypothetical protein NLI96_g13288 [Physisporinus lineatus]